VALALQGGGMHGAFSWGAVDALLEAGMPVDRICGVSSGALLGVMLAQGLVRGGRDGARADMRRLWQRVAQAHALSPLRNGPIERWLWGTDLSNNPAWFGIEAAMRMFSPAQLNPFGHNPLRPVIEELFDPALLAHPRAPDITIAATDVESGQPVCWRNEEITVDTLLASCCLPFVFPAVEIKGRAYWDGAYSGNPPLGPLLTPDLPTELVLVRALATRRRGTPHTPTAILDRVNDLACQGSLAAEIANLPLNVAFTDIDADAVLASLDVSSKFNADDAFLHGLFMAGRGAATSALRTSALRQAGDVWDAAAAGE